MTATASTSGTPGRHPSSGSAADTRLADLGLPSDATERLRTLVGVDEWATATGRPYVVYKYAASLDGRIAAADGTSRWISSRGSRDEVHQMRAACDAVVIGSGTQRSDDSRLAVAPDALARAGADAPKIDQPLRVVVDTHARTDVGARVLDGRAPTVIAVATDADASRLGEWADVVRVRRAPGGLDVTDLLAQLHARGVRSLLLEGGPTLVASFVAVAAIDRVVAYIAPVLLGAGPAALAGAGVATLDDAVRLGVVHVGRSGPDVRVVAEPATARRHVADGARR